LEKGLVLQAVTLAREWLVSWELARYLPERSDRWTSREAREEAEGKLNKGAQALKDGSSVATQLADRELYELWNQLADLRNDLAHGGMRESPRRTERVLFQVKQLVSRLRALVEGSDRSPD
ncbi:MAG: TIGR02221 family CRISPR-associated protein, partial [Thermomicrobium sp.]|nr:TIGR02221 family CRISPR-associated protein [Thermomicrobium sp.]